MSKDKKKELVKLSASRIQTLQKCSWLYFCNYTLKIRDEGNQATKYGTLVHLLFEQFGNPRHAHYINKIVQSRNIYKYKSILRLVEKTARKFNLGLDELIKPIEKTDAPTTVKEIINKMCILGLEVDFMDPAKKLIKAEYNFDISEEKYRYLGFIDRIFEKNGEIFLSDFKSSREKYHGEELNANIQAMIYLLASRKLFQDKKRHVRFIFLRFPDDPIAEPEEISEEVLDGFQFYLEHLNLFLTNFDYKKGISDLAAKRGYPIDGSFSGMMCCGYAKFPGHTKKTGELYYHCYFKFPFEYFGLYSSKGELLAASKDKNALKPQRGEYIAKMFYKGCPAFNKQNYTPKFQDF